MNRNEFLNAFKSISKVISENKDYLVELDQQNGDGDLGISMDAGFAACVKALEGSDITDLGKIMMVASSAFNEAAPSSLGTILSFGMMGMAKALKGKTDVELVDIGTAMDEGLQNIMKRAGSKAGEKTVLDALIPAVELLKIGGEKVWEKAAEAAAEGSEATRGMRSVHGRASYYGDKSIGMLDGGSVVGKLIFKGILASIK